MVNCQQSTTLPFISISRSHLRLKKNGKSKLIRMEKRRLQTEIGNCLCGSRASMRTSWTERNPGRRFLSCSVGKGEGCGFWEWYDPPMCGRAVNIIPGLLRRIDDLESEVDKFKVKIKKYESRTSKLEAKLKNAEAGEGRKNMAILCLLMFIFLLGCFLAIWPTSCQRKMCVGNMQLLKIDEY